MSFTSTPFKIISVALDYSAKNFPSPGPPPVISPLIWDNQFVGVFGNWSVERREGGYQVRNVGTGAIIVFLDGEIVCVNDEGVGESTWSIESAGPGTFIIGRPYNDLVWTMTEDGRVILRPADGSSEQRFALEPAGN